MPEPMTPEPYRDDVRELLLAAGWRETVEGHLVARNGARWTEINTSLDSGLEGADKAWSVEFDSGVPAPVIVAAALTASGVEATALTLAIAEVKRLRARPSAAAALHAAADEIASHAANSVGASDAWRSGAARGEWLVRHRARRAEGGDRRG